MKRKYRRMPDLRSYSTRHPDVPMVIIVRPGIEQWIAQPVTMLGVGSTREEAIEHLAAQMRKGQPD